MGGLGDESIPSIKRGRPDDVALAFKRLLGRAVARLRAIRCVTIPTMRPISPHDDVLEIALPHYNGAFRRRYRLPALQLEWLKGVDDLATAWNDGLSEAEASGLIDASCATLSRIALRITPRFAIGFLDGDGRVHVQFPQVGDDSAYRSHNVVLVNPIGGDDNWSQVTRWVRQQSKKQRSASLAGLASERRPDYQEIDRMLRGHGDERAHALPPDEAFSASLAAEVQFIFEVPIETLRDWKHTLRRDRAAGKPGRPRNR